MSLACNLFENFFSVLLLTVALCNTPVAAQKGEHDPEQSAAELMQPALPAIQQGLAYLATKQVEDGSFGSSGQGRNAAICGLGGLAFLTSGSTPDRGPYGKQVAMVTDFLLDHTSESGFIHVSEAGLHGPMYGHGFATLFLAEIYGMSHQSDLREKLVKAIELITRTQNSEGGWRYQPVRADADLSVTICQVMALRAARNGGIHVPSETIDRCIDYVTRCQNADGGFRYMLDDGDLIREPASAFPRSAAGVVALISAGVYEGQEIDKGLNYISSFLPSRLQRNRENHFYYGHYYAAQAMWHAGGKRWEEWYPAIRDTLLAQQRPDGSWISRVHPEYATSMACIILQMPNNTVPIFQR